MKYIRILLATISFVGLALLFVDLSGVLAPYFAFLGKWQLVPAILSGSAITIVLLLLLTFLLGRVYCSVLCPLGILQDGISRLASLDIMSEEGGRKRRKKRFTYARGNTLLRALALALFVVALLGGIPLLFGLLEPYSAFGRIMGTLFAPIWGVGNNVLADVAQRMDSFAFAPVPIWQKGFAALIGAVATLAVIAVLAWRNGRTWCNTICPVGAALGLVGRYAVLRPRIDSAQCVSCGQCEAVCKASCMSAKEKRVDASRCVACFNCLKVCRHDALHFMPSGKKSHTPAPKEPVKQPNMARRAALTGLVSGVASGVVTLAAAPLKAAGRDPDAPVPALTRKEITARNVPILPPGAAGLHFFESRCTGCQLCVSACPNQVLRTLDTGKGMLQPTLSFEHGYCRVNCVACSAVCPTGAIRPITPAEKASTQIGRAYVRPERCIVTTDKVKCTVCSRNCPPGAITLVGEGELKMPVVDNERCTGCGACEYLCPSRPLAAIYLEGNREHRKI